MNDVGVLPPYYKMIVCSTELQISLCTWAHKLVGFTRLSVLSLSLHIWNISGLDASFELLAQGLATYVFVVKTSSSADAWRPTFADSVNDLTLVVVSPSPCLGHLVAHSLQQKRHYMNLCSLSWTLHHFRQFEDKSACNIVAVITESLPCFGGHIFSRWNCSEKVKGKYFIKPGLINE
jgi:hypothetical protein